MALMGGTAPTLFWFDRADERIGILHPAGAVEHREELGGEDAPHHSGADDCDSH